MAECSFITDREAKILTGILAAIIIVPALWMARDVLADPQTMGPVLIGVPTDDLQAPGAPVRINMPTKRRARKISTPI